MQKQKTKIPRRRTSNTVLCRACTVRKARGSQKNYTSAWL